LEGVLNTSVGYTGGIEESPTYEEVKAHRTHHVEAVKVEFDADILNYEDLCKFFFEIHDPAQTDGVGPDIGPQYRSVIFYLDEQQRETAMSVINLLRSMGYEVNTKLCPVQPFWLGEEYHQDYYNKTGDSPYCHIRVKKF
jgi:peptide-methionine (S)-S-oxide reductase/peptide methionine sulfoxide reductase msrA/msrB